MSEMLATTTDAIIHRTMPAATRVPTRAPMPLPTRHFDLPPVLHIATAGLFLAFLGVMTLTFGEARLMTPMAICIISVVAMFTVPALWSRMGPDHADVPLAWMAFAERGIDTLTGRVTASQAMAQVLILPILIFGWGLIIAAIAIWVR